MKPSTNLSSGFSLLLIVITSTLSLHLAVAEPIIGTPNETQVIKALFNNLQATFPASQSCGENNSNPITVRDYLQTTLVYLAQEKSTGNMVQTNCDKAVLNNNLIDYYHSVQGTYSEKITLILRKMKQNMVLHQCKISFNFASGEKVWSRGIQFLIRGENSQVVRYSFRCLMLP